MGALVFLIVLPGNMFSDAQPSSFDSFPSLSRSQVLMEGSQLDRVADPEADSLADGHATGCGRGGHEAAYRLRV